jgi:hypothetical protein
MPTQNQIPTQDQVVQAGICVYDYVLNPAVRGEFQRVLASNATPTQQLNSSGPLSRRTMRSVKLIAVAAVAAVALLAAANTFARAENPTRMAREHHACAVIMGLHQPGDLYDTCLRSLEKSLSELDQVKLVSTNRTSCARGGLKPGTPAFAVCVVDAERSPADTSRNAAIAAAR